MTTSTEMTALEPAGKPRFTRASIARGSRRIGVIAVAAALATPLALPAFASGTGADAESYASVVAQDSQSVAGVVTAGVENLGDVRLDVQATTAEELEQIRAELEAAAEQERQEQAAQAGVTAGAGASAGATTSASAGASGNVIADTALAQVGVSQDCVALVRSSIGAAGLPYSGMGSLFNLGPTIPMSQASPGDVIYYSDGGVGIAHIAIYIGGGRAVHGGWSGYNTVVAGVNIGGSAPVFIDVT